MFTPMAKTVGFAILGALILSMTYIPMMCALFLSKKVSHKKNFSDKMMTYLYGVYQPLLEKAIKIKYWLVGGTLALFVVSLLLFKNMGGEFIPQLQEGDFAFHCILPQGSSLSQSVETASQASKIIKGFDEVKMVVAKTGSAEVPTDPMPPEATDLIIVLKPQKEWKTKKSYDELSSEIYEKLEVIPGIFFETNQPIQMRFNELMTGIRQDVAVKIFGENLDSLSIYGNKVSQVIKTVEGTSEPQIEQIQGLPEINVEYDRTRLANYGINVEDVNTVLSTAFAGKVAGQVFENERRFDLVVRLDSLYRTDIDDVSNLMIPTNTGNQIPLSQVATIEYKLGPAQISREAGKRRIYVGFNVTDRDVQSVVKEIQKKLEEKIQLPTGYYFTYGGQFENLEKATQRLLIAVPLSLLLIFALLYFTFNSVKQASLIFTAIPMSAIGGVFALLLRDMPFSISAGVGFIALFGVAVLNGIVLIGTFNQLEKDGVTDLFQRVLKGTKERLRPVLMTATVASVGFLPMALSQGAGAEVQKPLATVVIGGLITATFLTLFVLPLLYIIFNSKFNFRKRFKMKSVTTIIVLFLTSICFILNAQDIKVLSIDEALEIAVQNNGTIKSKNLELQSSQSLMKTAEEIPKLEFNAQLGQYSSKEFDQSFQISQTIPFPTLFGARKELLKAEVRGKELQIELSELELKNQVRTYFYQIQYLENNQKQLAYLDSLYIDFIRIAELRFKVGDIKKVEISTAEVKKGEIYLLLKQNEVYLNNAYQSLKALLNTEDFFKIKEENFQPLLASALMDETAIANHPAVKTLYQEALIAEQNKEIQKAQNLPDLTLGYTNQSLIGNFDVGGRDVFYGSERRFHSVLIGVSIPIFTASKVKIKAFDLTKKALEAKADQEKLELNAQLQNALQQYGQDVQQYRYYVDQALPNAKDIVFAAQLGYRTGEISYVEYLYALQTATDLQLNYLNSIQKINQSVININSIINQ
jgi:cobalt-zinc-cadmium resistance protein CzcA